MKTQKKRYPVDVVEEAIRFLRTWFDGCGGLVELRAIQGKKKNVERRFFPVDQPEEIAEWAAGLQDWDVYYGVCTRKDDSSGKETNLRDMPGLWLDFDFKEFAAGEIEVMDILDVFKYPPGLLVHSGGGIHPYWKFERSVPPTLKMKGQLKGLCRHLGADPAATDLSRIMRLPGTMNHKPQYGIPLQVVVLRGLN